MSGQLQYHQRTTIHYRYQHKVWNTFSTGNEFVHKISGRLDRRQVTNGKRFYRRPFSQQAAVVSVTSAFARGYVTICLTDLESSSAYLLLHCRKSFCYRHCQPPRTSLSNPRVVICKTQSIGFYDPMASEPRPFLRVSCKSPSMTDYT